MYSDVSKNDARPPVTATPPLRNPERDPPASTPPPPRPENRAQIRYFSPWGSYKKEGINYIHTPVESKSDDDILRTKLEYLKGGGARDILGKPAPTRQQPRDDTPTT